MGDLIEELKALAERATPGPWREDTGFEIIGLDGAQVCSTVTESALIFRTEDEAQANAALIIWLRNHVSAILSALEAVPVMKEALDFYANTPCNLEFGVVNVCTYDDGDKARQALAALEGK
jgi:hypothetical protein